MSKWSKDHVAAIGLIDATWLNWRSGGVLRWKVETASWEGRGVVCGKLAPSRL
jgi:hypothetical protein